MNRFWSDVVRRLEPYVPGEQPKGEDLVKLNTNENPYGPSPKALKSIAAHAGDSLRRYPPPEADALRDTLARYHGVKAEQVFVGNGSDEVLAHVFQAFFSGKGDLKADLWFPDITYSFYPVYCALYDIPYWCVPLDGELGIDLSEYRGAPGGIIFPNPNAPTGRALALADIETVLTDNPDSLVVVDEAYVDFGAESAIPLVARHDNLLVVQTLSKSRSLAGLRVGFAVGDEGLIEALSRVKNSFNSYPLDHLAIVGAVAAIEDDDYFQETRRTIMADRETLAEGLHIRGFEVLPSAANFVFARHPNHAGADLFRHLRENGVLVRHFGKPARIEDYLRITVGTASQHARFFEVLDSAL